jgi:hypothetical protein
MRASPEPFIAGIAFGFLRIIGSSIAGKHSAVLYGGDGPVGGLGDLELDEEGERREDVEGYGGFGLVFRPRPPEVIGGEELAAEAMGLRGPKGLVPVAWRDLRLHRRFPAPKAGSIGLVGYGGGFAAFDDTTADSGTEKASKFTLYVPYEFNGSGVPTKAHLIAVDPESESINILHADGGQFVLLPDKQIMAISDNSTWWNLEPGKFEVQADAINLIGTVSIGNPTLAVALLAGSTSQPSTRLRITTP